MWKSVYYKETTYAIVISTQDWEQYTENERAIYPLPQEYSWYSFLLEAESTLGP
jgi:hypothetical protein